MDAIRSWWEVPCVAHFCHIFQKPFKLPAFEIEEFEDSLLLDCFPTPSKLLVEIFCRFLDGIIDTEINEENWTLMLKLHLKWRCEHLKEKWNPLSGETEYKDLDTYSRVSIMHKLCHWRLELDDIGDLLRGLDGPSLRVEPVGRDMDGNTYWYFYGTRLYKEEGKKKKPKKKNGGEEVTPAKGAKQQQRKEMGGGTGGKKKGKINTPASQKATPASKRGRSKQVIQENATPSGRRSGRVSKRLQQVEEEGEEEEEKEEGGGSENRGQGDSQVHQEEENAVADTDNKVINDQEEEEEEDEGSKEGDSLEKKDDAETTGPGTGNGLISTTGWSVACTTVEEWNQVVESLKGSKHAETKRLLRSLQDFIPEVEHMFAMQEKQLKKRALADLPRRTSDRIAIKAAIKEEEERLEAMERERCREELRKLDAEEERAREEEAERKRQKRLEEALQRRKAREEQQQKLRQEEESNWEKAMSGELKGRRKAAIGAAENVSEVQRLTDDFLIADKDFDLYTAMHKILAGLRKHEEGWVFEEPVTEAIAPGYFEVVDKPMDYQTVEKKVEEQTYKTKEEFILDVELIYDNCCEYNGEDSEYFELAEEIRKLFQTLVGIHFEGKNLSDDKADGQNKKGRRRESRSPSACKTPEFTSESSSEEGSDDEGSDESYIEGRIPKRPKNKGPGLKLHPSLEQRLGSGFNPRMPPPMPHPQHMGHGPPPPHVYHQMMQQYYQQRMQRPPNMPPGPDMYSRLPPPYPGFPSGADSPRPHGPPVGMYPPPSPSEHHAAGMFPPSQDMMRPPMYPPTHHYPPVPPPPPSHPAHPAHPHHAAYRQHMMYEMHYHGMDPRMMGMRPGGVGMRPGGIRPGMGPRPNFQGMRPIYSPRSDSKSSSPASQSREKRSESEKAEDDGVESKPAELQEERENHAEGGEEKLEEVKEIHGEAGKEDKRLMKVREKKLPAEESYNEHKTEVQKNRKAEEAHHKAEEGKDKVEEEEEPESESTAEPNKAIADEKTVKSGRPHSAEKKMEKAEGAMMSQEQLEKHRYHQHMMAMHQRRESMVRGGYPFPPPPGSSPPFPPAAGAPSEEAAAVAAAYYAHHHQQHPHQQHYAHGYPPDPRQMELAAQQHSYWMEMEARRRYMMRQAEHANRSKQQRQQQQQQQQQKQTPQQQQQQQPQQQPQQVAPPSREGGGSGKERSAETGQEGLEDVPDYQDSLRQYALGLAEQEEKNSTETKDQASEEDGKSGSKRDSPSSQNQHPSRGQNKRQDTLNHLDNSNQKKWREHFTSGHSYPPASPSMMPNGYPIPPYGPHMPPYPPHQQMPPPEMMMRRNGGGFPPHPLDPYYSGHPSYRMPYYPGPPTHPTLHKQDGQKSSPGADPTKKDTITDNVATPSTKRPHPMTTPPPAKRPHPSS